jgi:hypothetical protein
MLICAVVPRAVHLGGSFAVGTPCYMHFRAFVSFLIVVTVVVAIALRMRRLRAGTLPPRSFQSTQEMMAWLANEAVGIAKKNGIQGMDYSIGSIKEAEQALGKLHEEYLRTKSEKGVEGLAVAFGAYVGECIRRESPGSHWERDHPIMGERSYPLYWKGGESFPCTWCYKRILNGPEDNICFKYQVLADSRAKVSATMPSAGDQPAGAEDNPK